MCGSNPQPRGCEADTLGHRSPCFSFNNHYYKCIILYYCITLPIQNMLNNSTIVENETHSNLVIPVTHLKVVVYWNQLFCLSVALSICCDFYLLHFPFVALSFCCIFCLLHCPVIWQFGFCLSWFITQQVLEVSACIFID